MTDTTLATPGGAADYRKTVRVQASPGALFDALTSVSGLAAWWAPVTGSGAAGGELRFLMIPSEPLVIHVDEAARPSSVRWTVIECGFLPDWAGTSPVFAIAPAGDGASELRFRHHGLTLELDCIEMCTRGWNHYLASLRAYVEEGRGSPRGSAADDAWRRGEADCLSSAE
jgi:uncharacterized protein YndB with AHSA1/START domain